jgi:hypothetical protein
MWAVRMHQFVVLSISSNKSLHECSSLFLEVQTIELCSDKFSSLRLCLNYRIRGLIFWTRLMIVDRLICIPNVPIVVNFSYKCTVCFQIVNWHCRCVKWSMSAWANYVDSSHAVVCTVQLPVIVKCLILTGMLLSWMNQKRNSERPSAYIFCLFFFSMLNTDAVDILVKETIVPAAMAKLSVIAIIDLTVWIESKIHNVHFLFIYQV